MANSISIAIEIILGIAAIRAIVPVDDVYVLL